MKTFKQPIFLLPLFLLLLILWGCKPEEPIDYTPTGSLKAFLNYQSSNTGAPIFPKDNPNQTYSLSDISFWGEKGEDLSPYVSTYLDPGQERYKFSISYRNLQNEYDASTGDSTCKIYIHFGSSEVDTLMIRYRYDHQDQVDNYANIVYNSSLLDSLSYLDMPLAYLDIYK